MARIAHDACNNDKHLAQQLLGHLIAKVIRRAAPAPSAQTAVHSQKESCKVRRAENRQERAPQAMKRTWSWWENEADGSREHQSPLQVHQSRYTSWEVTCLERCSEGQCDNAPVCEIPKLCCVMFFLD